MKNPDVYDTAYLSAIERGDMETAQRMVDEGTHTRRDGRPRPSENEMGEGKRTPRIEAFFRFVGWIRSHAREAQPPER